MKDIKEKGRERVKDKEKTFPERECRNKLTDLRSHHLQHEQESLP